jgi:hypothetical protein
MRTLRFTLFLLLALLLPVASAGARTQHRRSGDRAVIADPHWYRVAKDVAGVTASDRYAALTSTHGQITLLNERTDARTALSPPDCPTAGKTSFGGPWLAVRCDLDVGGQTTWHVDLYNLTSRRWKVEALESAMCSRSQTTCIFDAVGRVWIRFFALESDCAAHCSPAAYLQSIATGAVEPDPANDSRRQDSLDTSSGIGHPCARLTSSALSLPYQSSFMPPLTDYWVHLGRFVLTTGVAYEIGATPDRLRRCGSRVSRRLPRYLVASSRMVLWPEGGNSGRGPLRGLYLPGLRPFVVYGSKGAPVALSGSTVYEISRDSELWAAKVAPA